MVPVLGWEVEEGEQSFPVLGQAGDRLLATGKPYLSYCREAVLTPLGIIEDFKPDWQVMGPTAPGAWREKPFCRCWTCSRRTIGGLGQRSNPG
jgi:hypothetical protein